MKRLELGDEYESSDTDPEDKSFEEEETDSFYTDENASNILLNTEDNIEKDYMQEAQMIKSVDNLQNIHEQGEGGSPGDIKSQAKSSVGLRSEGVKSRFSRKSRKSKHS